MKTRLGQASLQFDAACLLLDHLRHSGDKVTNCTGLRHFPEEDDVVSAAEHSSQLAAHAKRIKEGNFQFKSSKQCYEEFPGLVRSGFLLPSSQTLQPVELDLQEGPLSGQRQRPDVVDLADKKRPRIPGERQSPEALLREVVARRMD